MTKPSDVKVVGPLLPFVSGFIEELAGLGYSPLSAANQVRVLAHLSRWMVAEDIDGGGLGPGQVAEFLRARRDAGYTCWLSERGLGPLLSFLRGVGAVPAVATPVIEGPLEELLDAYRGYLKSERGLVAGTVSRRISTARLVLAPYEGLNETPIEALTAPGVRDFVVRECSVRKIGSARLLMSELRCLLRFLFVSGRVASDLSLVVPAVAGHGGWAPKGVDRGVVARLLAGCDTRTPVGSRDHAILVLLIRLGLRAGEVAALSLEDIDWRAGEITVVGKGNRHERLPLPVDVGEALVGYLHHRRRSAHRSVFIQARAPHNPITTGAIKMVVRQACVRVGVLVIGPHRLRHSAATDMLRAGASLNEVGQVLRHRGTATTAIYAKADPAALRSLALPWPGQTR